MNISLVSLSCPAPLNLHLPHLITSPPSPSDSQTVLEAEAKQARKEEEEGMAKVSVPAARPLQSEAEAEAQSGKEGCTWEPTQTCSIHCTPIRHEQ